MIFYSGALLDVAAV